MIKNVLKNKIVMGILVGSMILTTGYVVKAANYEPGSNEDPIVTKSYVDLQIDRIKEYIDNKTQGSNENTNNPSNIGNSPSLEIVNVSKDQKIILDSGSQIILRGGKGKIIDSPNGGIADLTQGVDLKMNYDAPANHLLMIPKSDGRGIKAITDCIFMVVGKYTIQ